tara:strand:- start:502310 stop:502414 length:105 start_codon:yes stop_codon:yes gene_type:complete
MKRNMSGKKLGAPLIDQSENELPLSKMSRYIEGK